jgi:hypothetical protein
MLRRGPEGYPRRIWYQNAPPCVHSLCTQDLQISQRHIDVCALQSVGSEFHQGQLKAFIVTDAGAWKTAIDRDTTIALDHASIQRLSANDLTQYWWSGMAKWKTARNIENHGAGAGQFHTPPYWPLWLQASRLSPRFGDG